MSSTLDTDVRGAAGTRPKLRLAVRDDAGARQKLQPGPGDQAAGLERVADNTPALVDYVDAGLRYRYNNRTYERWFGIGRDRITGRSMRDVFGEEAYEVLRPHVEAVLAGRSVNFEADVMLDGSERHLQGSYVPDLDDAGRVRGFYGLTCDVTPHKQQLMHRAQHDQLTGAANRFLFQDRLERAIARSRRHGSMLALMYLDIDQFKSINDELGHAVGDALLQEFAARLRRCVRTTDTVARLGGDEFTLVLEDLRRHDDALQIAEKILRLVREPVHACGHRITVTTSIGIAFARGEDDNPDTLLQHADTALYQAKRDGRDTWRLGK